jgi:protein TonB
MRALWEERGGFPLALSVSLLAHGVLLFATPLPLPLQTPRSPGAIEVSLSWRTAENPHARLEDEAVPPAPEPAPPKPQSRQTRRMSPPTPTSAPTKRPTSAVAETPVLVAAKMENGQDEDTGAVSSAVAPASAPAAASGGTDGVAGAVEGMDDALLDYRIAIASTARKFKRYPTLSRERGREGRVEIRLTWRPGMRAPQVELHRSGGDTLLDEQGLDMLRRAVLQTPLPDILRERAFSFVQAVEFSLKDAN